MADASSSGPTATAFHVIRILLLIGVVLVAGALWYVAQRLDGPILDAEMQATIQYPVLGLFAAIALGVFFIRKKWDEEAAPDRKRALTIVGWALAEGLALIGAVYYLLTGTAAFFLVGLLVQIVVSFYYIPIPQAASAGP